MAAVTVLRSEGDTRRSERDVSNVKEVIEMPAKVLPDALGFAWLAEELERMGFRSVTGVEFRKDFARLGLRAPRSRPGREAGFVFTANGLTVKVWTTWLLREEEAREEDAGWVLIAQGDEPLYFSHPLHRTKNFLRNLLRQAWVARFRVLHRPLCPECTSYMAIVRGRGLKARYWRCDRVWFHAKARPVSLDWDAGLPPRAKDYVDSLRERRETYERERISVGEPSKRALLVRRPWRRR